jgi:SAM-dependent methyltransferase
LVASWWAEFNDDFRPHEIPYFRAAIEGNGQPALDVGCGAGRLLLPFLREGVDVDGCDVSADMIEACRRKAAGEGMQPNLYVQPMHALDLPRRYRTIFVCGSFGLGSDRQRDTEALVRFREHLAPGGTLLIDIEVRYADPQHWRYWLQAKRSSLPEQSTAPDRRRRAADGSEYALASRLISVDPLEQRVTMAIRIERWRDGMLEADEERLLHIGMYFKNEMLLMLKNAGFTDVEVHGEHQERPPTSDDEFIVFVARV